MGQTERMGVAARAEPDTRLGYRPALDGIRAVALVAILVYHQGFGWARGGFLSLSTFFTLSGFLIATLLLEERAHRGAVGLRAFWLRRFRRLMPAALLCLALIVAAAFAGLWDAVQLGSLRGDVVAALADVANWRFIVEDRGYAGLFAAPSPLQHYWSLAVEEQFYVLFPLLAAGLLALGRGRRRLFGVAVAALAVLSTIQCARLFDPADTARAYYGTDTRMAELLLGVLLAVAVVGRLSPRRISVRHATALLGLAALAATVFLWWYAAETDAWMFRGGFAGYALLSCALIYGALQPGPLRALLAWGPLVWLGRISYGVYLLHWPMFMVLDEARTGLGGWSLFGVRIAATISAAAVSFYVLEQPVRERRWPRRRVWRVALLPVAAAGVAVAVMGATVEEPRTVLAANAVPDAPPPPPAEPEARVAGTRTAPLRVAVLGDSVASGIAAGLYRWADDDEMVVIDATGLGCGTSDRADIVSYIALTHVEVSDDCRRRVDEVVAQRPDIVLVHHVLRDVADTKGAELGDGWRHVGESAYDDWYRAEWTALAERLAGTGARVMWFLPAQFGSNGDSPVVPGQEARLDALRGLLGELTAARGIATLDLQPIVDGFGSDEREDGVHYSLGENDRIASWLGPEMLRIGATLPRAQVAVEAAGSPGSRRVLVVGGSSAASLLLALREVPGVEAVDATAPGCGMVPSATPDARCDARWVEWPALVALERPDAVLVVPEPDDLADRVVDGEWLHLDPTPAGSVEFLRFQFSAYGRARDLLMRPGADQFWVTIPGGRTDPAALAIVDQFLVQFGSQAANTRVVDLAAGLAGMPAWDADGSFAEPAAEAAAGLLGPELAADR